MLEFRQLFLEWVQRVCRAKNLPEEVVAVAGGEVSFSSFLFLVRGFFVDVLPTPPSTTHHNTPQQVFIMGSYKLNVHEPGADIDLCCVVPMHVQRDEFFTSFYETLR